MTLRGSLAYWFTQLPVGRLYKVRWQSLYSSTTLDGERKRFVWLNWDVVVAVRRYVKVNITIFPPQLRGNNLASLGRSLQHEIAEKDPHLLCNWTGKVATEESYYKSAAIFCCCWFASTILEEENMVCEIYIHKDMRREEIVRLNLRKSSLKTTSKKSREFPPNHRLSWSYCCCQPIHLVSRAKNELNLVSHPL